MMPITEWPSAERPREKLLTRGANYLSDAELLAIFLRTGTSQKSAVDIGRDLLTQFGSLRELLEAPAEQILAQNGIGEAKYALLLASVELGRRHLAQSLSERDLLTTPSMVKQFLRAQLRHYKHEVFTALFLDSQNRFLAFEQLFNGTIDACSIHPREVVKRALAHHASRVIFAHNHPSGHAEPSAADHHITARLTSALALLDIQVLDHFIIGEREIISLAERGQL
ncbi:RadC family protein [Agitococcus lubricus]|uniref:DNA replication and repair protein RadC n=1 Tax=Agitococcus lubricus TaxID=1077255 RepID=A0A2T5IYS3_9GAMM|nr:DNA repair protein RadC [Agitococcus lubricus]PTQ89165.1 DNA replication and repair protein RadC [Agitococcus lubricus]